MTEKFHLCSLDDIPENNSRGFTLNTPGGPLNIFLVRTDTSVRGYINSCPHTGVNLDWTPDQFLDAEGKYIQCATHGALFQIENGFCKYGPCTGESLTAVRLHIEEDEIHLLL